MKKKRDLRIPLAVIFVVLLLLLLGRTALAADAKVGSELFPVESTAYYEGEITASGQKAREGIVAEKKEWLGLTCIVYADDNGKCGEYIGIYEILDTGSDYRIENGTCIDFYMLDESDCWEWGRRKVWIQLVDAAG